MKRSAQKSRNERRTFSSGAYLEELMAKVDRACIGARLKQARNKVGLTQPDLADLIHVHFRTIQNYESGERDIPLDLLDALATFTQTTSEWLLYGEEVAAIQPLSDAVEARLQGLEDGQARTEEALGAQRALLDELLRRLPPEEDAQSGESAG